MIADIALILVTVAAVVSGQLLLKMGMLRVGVVDRKRIGRPLLLARDIATTPAVVVGLVIYALSAAMWIVVLSRVPLSFAYPFLGLSYASVTVVAVVWLKEHFVGRQWVGVACIVAGVVLVATTGSA